MHLEIYLCSVINGTVGVVLSKNNNFQKKKYNKKTPPSKKIIYKISSIKICFPNSMHSSFFHSHAPQSKWLAFQITCNYMFHPCHGARPWKMKTKVPYREQYSISFKICFQAINMWTHTNNIMYFYFWLTPWSILHASNEHFLHHTLFL